MLHNNTELYAASAASIMIYLGADEEDAVRDMLAVANFEKELLEVA